MIIQLSWPQKQVYSFGHSMQIHLHISRIINWCFLTVEIEDHLKWIELKILHYLIQFIYCRAEQSNLLSAKAIEPPLIWQSRANKSCCWHQTIAYSTSHTPSSDPYKQKKTLNININEMKRGPIKISMVMKPWKEETLRKFQKLQKRKCQ